MAEKLFIQHTHPFFFSEPPTPGVRDAEPEYRPTEPSKEMLEFARFLESAPEDIRREVIEFARFKLQLRKDRIVPRPSDG